MGISKLITCDNCGTAKGQNNHWFVALCDLRAHDLKTIHIEPFDSRIDHEHSIPQWDILCGEACVHTWLSLNLSRISGATAQLESRSDHPAATSAREPASLEQIHSVVNTVLDKWEF